MSLLLRQISSANITRVYHMGYLSDNKEWGSFVASCVIVVASSLA